MVTNVVLKLSYILDFCCVLLVVYFDATEKLLLIVW